MIGTDSDAAWRRWGERDPYFAVLAAPRFRGTSLAAHRDEFFALGEDYVEERLELATQHFGAFGRTRALDFGCGVGRLALPLARHFANVTGLDIAPAMLDEARRNMAAARIDNVRFRVSDDTLSAAEGRFDFVLSSLVLQHIPVRRGMPILGRLIERVEVGGVAALQICIDRRDTRAERLRYWAQRHVPGMHGLFGLLRGRSPAEPMMQMNAYPLAAALGVATDLGFGPCLIQNELHGRFLVAQLLMRRVSTGVLAPGRNRR